MAEVVILGYYGRGNLGDETNLKEIIKLLREFPELGISVISAHPELTANGHQVAALGRFQIKKIWSALRRADFLIGGGGTLFQDKTSLRSLIYYAAIIILAKLSRVRIILYGQGIGPINSWWGRWIAAYALSMVETITVRDRLSVIALAEMGVVLPEVYFTAEPLLALNPLTQEEVTEYWKNRTGVARLGLILKAEPGLKNFWKQFLDNLRWEKNLEVFLIVMDDQDRELCMELASAYDADLAIGIGNWDELLRLMGGMDLLLSMRLHGLVAAAVQGTPCYGLAVDPKIDGFCLQWGIPFIPITPDADQVAVYNRVMAEFLEPLEERRRWYHQKDLWQARSHENHVILKEFIKKGRSI